MEFKLAAMETIAQAFKEFIYQYGYEFYEKKC